MDDKALAAKIKLLPLSTGIYIFKDKNGAILYVGKAIKLRSRVRSYFSRPDELSPAKQLMVKRIADVETIITSSEKEALILESVLIKKHQPPYNVTLKDDKNYQFIKIDYRPTRPTVSTVRRPEFDRGRSQARYFGPYTSGWEVQESLRLLRRIFPYRKQDKELTLFEKDLLQKRTLGPLPQTEEEYRLMINRLIRVLEGHSEAVMAELKNWMTELSNHKHFEQAARVRDQIQGLANINSRQKIVSVHGESQDVISLYRQADVAAVNLFVIRAGKLIDKLNFILQHAAGESDTTVLDAFLKQYYSQATNIPKELIIPVATSLIENDLSVIASAALAERSNPEINSGIASARSSPRNDTIKITLPSHGKKRDLIKLGVTNARDYLTRSLASLQQQKNEPALQELQTALKLKQLPRRIEGYDISNIQGQHSVGAMVVFTNAEPDKNEYRKFKIKTVRGANDFAMLAEVLKRRFKHAGWQTPDLVLLDGGPGQLSTVLNSFTNNQLPITNNQFIALAKRAEEIFQGPNGRQVNLSPQSPASHLLQRVRDEAHRFAQKYYHTLHSKSLKSLRTTNRVRKYENSI